MAARSYPGPRKVEQRRLPGVAALLRESDSEDLDVTAAAHDIAMHALELLPDARYALGNTFDQHCQQVILWRAAIGMPTRA